VRAIPALHLKIALNQNGAVLSDMYHDRTAQLSRLKLLDEIAIVAELYVLVAVVAEWLVMRGTAATQSNPRVLLNSFRRVKFDISPNVYRAILHNRHAVAVGYSFCCTSVFATEGKSTCGTRMHHSRNRICITL
jgi:hypothetical protein